MPLKFWDQAFLAATYLINRIPSRVINNMTPLHKLFQRQVDYNSLRTFGCACWPNLRPYNTHKLAFRSKQCVFLGYSNLHKGFKCLDIPTGRIYISRDVTFDEHVFPFSKLHSNAGARFTSESLLIPSSRGMSMHDHVPDVLSAGATNADPMFQEKSAEISTENGGISCVLPQLHTTTNPGVDAASLPLGGSGVSPSNSAPAAVHSTRGERDARPPPVLSPTTAPASPAPTRGGLPTDPPAPDSGAHGGAMVPGSSENPVSPSRAKHGVSGSGVPSASHEADTGGSSAAADPEAARVHDAARSTEVSAVL